MLVEEQLHLLESKLETAELTAKKKTEKLQEAEARLIEEKGALERKISENTCLVASLNEAKAQIYIEKSRYNTIREEA